jgi:hypothetical protein
VIIMVNASWLFGDHRHADAQVVIVEEQGADDDGQAASGSGQQLAPSGNGSGDGGGGSEQAANPARGSNDGQADAGDGQEATTAPKRSRDDDTQAAADNNAQPAAVAKRSRPESSSEGTVVLPIHRLIVMSASEFFKARLDGDAWNSTNDEGGPCRVVLHVPPGQLELGRRFVRALYDPKPGFADLSIEQQLQLLRLADRYGAPKVVAAAAAAAGMDVYGYDADIFGMRCTRICPDELAWAAVRAAYSSPAGPPASPSGFDYHWAPEEDNKAGPPPPAPALRQYADDALQLLFGDLEAAWTWADDDDEPAPLPLPVALPHAALVALLADERTRAASENVVVHTILRWVAESNVAPSSAQAKELLALVRVARLTPHYARTVFCESEVAKAHLSARELALASMLPLAGDAPLESLRDRQHWCLPARPRSAVPDTLAFEWSMSLSGLEARVTALLTEGDRDSMSIDVWRWPRWWQGWGLRPVMDCRRSASGGVTLGLYLAVEPPCSTAGALIERSFEAIGADGGSGIKFGPSPCLYAAGINPRDWADFLGLDTAGGGGDNGAGPPKDWAGIEAALRAAGVVHGEGRAARIELRCEVTRIE